MFEKLFPGGGAALRAAMLAKVDRPKRTARPNLFSGGVAWEDSADAWTESGVTWGTGVVDSLGARLPMAATATEDSIALVYTTRTLSRKTDRGTGKRGTGARWTAIFKPVEGIKEMALYVRGTFAGTPTGGQEYGSFGISRLEGETSIFAFTRGASPEPAERRALGAYTEGNVYLVSIDVVGYSIEFSLYDMTDARWLARGKRLSSSAVPGGITRFVVSVSTKTGGTAASLELGDVEVYPEFAAR